MELLKFEADWCQPCKTLTKVMKGMDYTVVDIETEVGEQMARSYRVQRVPTLILADPAGNEISRLIGLHSRRQIDRWIREVK